MANPMDRDFGDDPIRRMERLKFERRKERRTVDDFDERVNER